MEELLFLLFLVLPDLNKSGYIERGKSEGVRVRE